MIHIKPFDRVNPSLVKQYYYCPVIPWIQANLMVAEPTTDSMVLGSEAVKPPTGRGQVRISTSRGATIIDEVIEEKNGKIIIEKKAFKSHNFSRYVSQAITSYVIAREKLPGVRKVRIAAGSKIVELEVNDQLVNDVEASIRSVERIISENNLPKPGEQDKCSSCWYRRFCPYV
ncbi:CRISPR-associated protein Cas4 [Desulfurococcus amylolyticus]|uniref:CRISPR-associated exonuclease Cas4 n=1 Tax=Desulfurococcus amylolyticus DSM 16532 TaxID=768672 RepID=I3XSH3_DESAM|nr:CRISPR-associated protein Cas4 [Desulfurococcus amylolyticus]AFL66897.1 CRISPR-associated protein Cas4 [Desulfurococcus amylolyticus DSM 16532]